MNLPPTLIFHDNLCKMRIIVMYDFVFYLLSKKQNNSKGCVDAGNFISVILVRGCHQILRANDNEVNRMWSA